MLSGGFPDAFFIPWKMRAVNLVVERLRYGTEFLDLSPGTHALER